MSLPTRVIAFIKGDMAGAEDLTGYTTSEDIPIVQQAMDDQSAELAKSIQEIAIRSRDSTAAAVAGMQNRAASFLTLVLGLIPLGFVGASLALPGANADPVRWLSFLTFSAAIATLILSAVYAALATGFGLTSTINLSRLDAPGAPKTEQQLRAIEAKVLNQAAELNMIAGQRRGRDLFQSRRFALIATSLALAALVVLAFSGEPLSALRDDASPSPTRNQTPVPTSTIVPPTASVTNAAIPPSSSISPSCPQAQARRATSSATRA